jgi:hypothetical protein
MEVADSTVGQCEFVYRLLDPALPSDKSMDRTYIHDNESTELSKDMVV